MLWSDAARVLSGLIDFGRVLSTRLTARHSVLANLRGIEGDGENEDVADCEVWGVAGVQSRPKAPTSAGGQTRGAEVLFYRPGDELVVVASRDLRFQPSVAEGEVVVHALGIDGATQALVRLKPSGVVEISATQLLIGASEFVRVEPGGFSATRHEAMAAAFAAHTHPSNGAPPDAASVSAMNAAGSSKVSIPP